MAQSKLAKAFVIIIILAIISSMIGTMNTQAASSDVVVGANPFGIVFCPTNGYLYVTNQGSLIDENSVSVIDPVTNTVIKTFVFPNPAPDQSQAPKYLAYDEYNDKIFVTLYGVGQVAVIDPDVNEITATITIGDRYTGTNGICYDSNNKHIYVSNYVAASITEIDGATNTIVRTITTGSSQLGGLLYNTVNGYLYVCGAEGGHVYVLDPNNSYNLVEDVGINNAQNLAYNPVTNMIFVTTDISRVFPIYGSTNIPGTGWLVSYPQQIALNPNNGYFYVTCSEGVYVFNGANNAYITTIPSTVVPNGQGIAFNPEDGNMYVACSDSSNGFVHTIEVSIPLTVSVSPTSWAMDVGQSKVFTATASGGSGSYTSYQWYVNGAIQSGQIASTFTYTPGSVGSYSINVTVTDSLAATATLTSTVPVTVNSNPTVSVQPGTWTMDIGQSKIFTAVSGGGVQPYSYTWYVDSVSQAETSSSFSFTPSAVGSHTLSVTMTDSLGGVVGSFANVEVASTLLAPAISGSTSSINQGETMTLNSGAISTGVAPYSYQWLQKAPGASEYLAIIGATSSTYNFVTSGSTMPGIWSFKLQITDGASSPATITSSETTVTLIGVPTVTIFPSSGVMDVGQSKVFTATASGGSGSYTSYQWYVDGIAQTGQTSSTFTYIANSVGSPLITATVTDSLDVTSVQSSAPGVTVSTELVAPTTSTSASSVTQGQTSTLTGSTITTGSSPYSYQWFNKLPSASAYAIITGATSSSYNFVTSTSTTSGIWQFILQTTDSAGAATNSTALSITVNLAPTPTPAPTSSSSNTTPKPTAKPTQSPTPTPTLTPEPTNTSQPTATPSPQQTETSTVLYGAIAAAAVLITIIAAIFLRKKKPKKI